MAIKTSIFCLKWDGDCSSPSSLGFFLITVSSWYILGHSVPVHCGLFHYIIYSDVCSAPFWGRFLTEIPVDLYNFCFFLIFSAPLLTP